MNIFYRLTTLLGILFVVCYIVVPYYGLAFEYSPSVLAAHSNQWDITMDESLKGKLSRCDVKQDLEYALSKRSLLIRDPHATGLWFGLTLIVFAEIGLFRERKFKKMKM